MVSDSCENDEDREVPQLEGIPVATIGASPKVATAEVVSDC